jgi:hypothetical protein
MVVMCGEDVESAEGEHAVCRNGAEVGDGGLLQPSVRRCYVRVAVVCRDALGATERPDCLCGRVRERVDR